MKGTYILLMVIMSIVTVVLIGEGIIRDNPKIMLYSLIPFSIMVILFLISLILSIKSENTKLREELIQFHEKYKQEISSVH